MSLPFMIFLAAVGAVVVFVIVTYNRLVSLTQRAQSSWSDVDVQLKSYPELKASGNFQPLLSSRGETEEYIQSGRRYFNAVVRDLNTAIQEFPSNLVAGFFQFRPRSSFELDRPEERQVPTVSFGA